VLFEQFAAAPYRNITHPAGQNRFFGRFTQAYEILSYIGSCGLRLGRQDDQHSVNILVLQAGPGSRFVAVRSRIPENVDGIIVGP